MKKIAHNVAQPVSLSKLLRDFNRGSHQIYTTFVKIEN
jgi:predicted AAA+ superfamily ATPase